MVQQYIIVYKLENYIAIMILLFTSIALIESAESVPVGIEVFGDFHPHVCQYFFVEMVHVSRVPYARSLPYFVYKFFRKINHVEKQNSPLVVI